jgi:hypothetical protein
MKSFPISKSNPAGRAFVRLGTGVGWQGRAFWFNKQPTTGRRGLYPACPVVLRSR